MASFGLLVIVFLVVIVLASILGRRDPAWLKGDTPGPWCGGCGYSLYGHASTHDRCPECGVSMEAVPRVVSRMDFGRGLRLRLWRWTWRFLGGFALFCFLLLPGASYYDVRASCGYRSYREDTDLPYVDRQFTLETAVTRWWLGWIPVWRTVEPLALRCSEQRDVTSSDDPMTDAEVSVDASMERWSYTPRNGPRTERTGEFNSDAILAWLKDSGIPTDSQRVRDETAFLAECVRNLARHPRFTPSKQPFQSYDVRLHVPVGSNSPLPPMVILLPCVAVSLAVWYLGAARIRRQTPFITLAREAD